MTTEITTANDRPTVSGRIVEVTDEDETIVITFIPVVVVPRRSPSS